MQRAGSPLNAIPRVQKTNPSEVKPGLVCFSHLRWGFVYQRPQHLLTRAARTYKVFFFEEPLFEAGAAPRLEFSPQPGGVTVVTPVVPEGMEEGALEAVQRRLMDQLLSQVKGGPLVFWYYTPMALAFTGEIEPDLCIYDCMDELSAFLFAPAKLRDRERALLKRADLVFTGGQSLYEAKKGRHPSVHAFPSSIDAPHFARARSRTVLEPADQAAVPHPRLGFFGVIDERMDLELLAAMAELRPAWQFVMIGPVVKVDPASLPRRDNIHWLGGKGYEELPDYLAGWDVGLMPFAMNESTRFISPTKTPEFLAAGVPVVSTPVVDVVRSYGEPGLVEIAADAVTAVAKAEALMSRPRLEWLARVDRHLAGLSWDKTWGAMHALMRRELDAPEMPAARSKGAARV